MEATRISRILDSFMQAKTLLVACKLGLFTYLSNGPKPGPAIAEELGINPFGLYDFLDALVALEVLDRDGILETAVYRNTPEAEELLVDGKGHCLTGMARRKNAVTYNLWNHLEDGLKTGKS